MSTSERRLYTRLSMQAYAVNVTCRLLADGLTHRVNLVDISAGGARLRFDRPFDPERFPLGSSLSFSLENRPDQGLLQSRDAEVRWCTEQELGLRFLSPLPLGAAALQTLVG